MNVVADAVTPIERNGEVYEYLYVVLPDLRLETIKRAGGLLTEHGVRDDDLELVRDIALGANVLRGLTRVRDQTRARLHLANLRWWQHESSVKEIRELKRALADAHERRTARLNALVDATQAIPDALRTLFDRVTRLLDATDGDEGERICDDIEAYVRRHRVPRSAVSVALARVHDHDSADWVDDVLALAEDDRKETK